MATALVALASTTLAASAASVSFSVPSGYRDIRLVINFSTATEGNAFLRVNGDTGTNYSSVNMRGSGSGAQSSAPTGSGWDTNFTTGLTAGERAINTYDFMDYSATDKHKTVLIRGNHAGEVDAIAGRWANTSAITGITVYGSGGGAQFAAGSTFTLYGIVS